MMNDQRDRCVAVEMKRKEKMEEDDLLFTL
jgi:hypothetical protein